MKQSFKRFFNFIILFLCIMFIFPINIYAYDDDPRPIANRRLVITADIDPRVSATGKNVYLFFRNKTYNKEVPVTLYAVNNYETTEKVYDGDYTFESFMVSNDFTGYYTVSCDDFSVNGVETSIKITVGDPKFDGEFDSVNAIVGTIDREATNELRKKRGIEPIDWDEVDRKIASGEYSLDPDEETTASNDNQTTNNSQDATDTTINATITSPTTAATTTTTTPTTTQSKTEKKDENKFPVIPVIFLTILIIVIAIALYRKRRRQF